MRTFLTRLLAFVLLLAPQGGSANLVAYYSFDTGFNDSSGNGNDLTVANGTPNITAVPGETVFGGGALNLVAAESEYLNLGSALNFGAADAWSVSFWARRNAGSNPGMVMGNDGVNNSFIWSTDAFSGMRFRPESSSSASNDFTAPKDTSYHHYVMVADGTGHLSLYVDNGSAQVINPANGGTSFTIDSIGHAYSNLAYTFGGQLDEIHIYDEVIDAAKVAELFNGAPDTTPPTLAGSDMVDDRAGGPVEPGSLVTYTVSFSEDMDDTTVSAADFGSAGTASYTFGAVSEVSPGVFTVEVTPNTAGTLQLQVNAGAVLSDAAGYDLDTTTAIIDDTSIFVETDSVDPTLSGSDLVDDQGGGPVVSGTLVTYTISFSEDMDDATVGADDFTNAGTAAFTIGSVTEVSPGVFAVEITPSSTGTLQLQVLAGAVLADAAGNPLDTTSAIVADGSLTVEESLESAVRRVRVVLVGGQSNADGRAAASGLPTSPVNLQLPQDDVDFFYRVEGTIYPLTTLRPGLSETGGFGPAITCGRLLADVIADGTSTRIAVIKYANGGTNLSSQWAGGGDATTSGDGSQYVRFQETVTAGLASLSSTYPNAVIELVGMIWLQGESDAGSASTAYEANLTNFLVDLRATISADLRFVVIRLSSGQTAVNATGLANIRAAQTAVAAADPLTGLVDTDGFGMKGDNLHFNVLGQQQIGDASAMQLLNFLPFQTPMAIGEGVGGEVEISVPDAFPGFVYELQTNPGLEPIDWVEVASKTAAGSVVDFSYTPLAGDDQRFFRVGRSLP